MPEPDPDTIIDYDENTVLNIDQHFEMFLSKFSTLNRKQFEVCQDVINSIEQPNHNPDRLFFVDGPGGTGKTYLLEVTY